VLAPGESAVNYLGHVVSTAGEDDAVARAGLEALARAPARAFMAGEQRWSDYVARAVRLSPAYSGTPGYRVAAVKALVTLLGNWRRPLGGLRHDALAASSSATGASVFGAGDAWKHAAALARIYPELAVSQVRAMFDAQDAEGMVPGAVRSDAAAADGLASAPPLAAWAVWEVFRQTADRSFLHDMQPRLQRYHEWWGRRRDRDQDGLCEWGASVDHVEAATGESGMEGAHRFDKASLHTRDDRSWTLDLESVDLNAWLLAEKRYLAQISKELLREDSSLGPAAAKLEAGIRAWMFDVKSGYFRDAAADGRGSVAAPGPEGWIALWAGAATTRQAALARQALVDPRRFATPIPFPSLAADDPAFDAGSRWRGGVRPDLAFFAVTGLRRYRFNEDARRLAGQLLDGAKGLTTPGPPIREAYHALTGEGLGASDFGPTAAALLLMLLGG
jgi:putative isomerase